jgi:uncharacterized damage-inducible protein DinB
MPATAITAEQAHALLHNFFLATMKNESRTTKTIMEAVPADKSAYQPDPCAKSAIELVRHIAVADNFFIESVVNGVFNPGSVTIPDSVKTPAEVASWYEETYAKNFDALTKLSGDQLIKILDFRGLFQQPAVLFLQFGLVHGIHHRGQLSTYLRPMGSRVPAIYGESYDSALAKKAAQVQA